MARRTPRPATPTPILNADAGPAQTFVTRETYFQTLDELLRAWQRQEAMLEEERLLAADKILDYVRPRLALLAQVARERPCQAPPWTMAIDLTTGTVTATPEPELHPCLECANTWYRDWLAARGRPSFLPPTTAAPTSPAPAETDLFPPCANVTTS